MLMLMFVKNSIINSWRVQIHIQNQWCEKFQGTCDKILKAGNARPWNVQLLNCSIAKLLDCSIAQLFNYSIVQLFDCSITQSSQSESAPQGFSHQDGKQIKCIIWGQVCRQVNFSRSLTLFFKKRKRILPTIILFCLNILIAIIFLQMSPILASFDFVG